MLHRMLVYTTLVVVWAIAAEAFAQTGPWGQPSSPTNRPVAGPDQPVVPQNTPTLHRRPPASNTPQSPFTLTPPQQAYLEQVLKAWEERGDRVKTFSCNFVRWEFDPVFQANGPVSVDSGEIRYGKPDRGMFHVTHTAKGQEWAPIEEERNEHWVCDGSAIFEVKASKKQVIERRLPPEMQGKAIANGPLPFLFGAKADNLKQRYWMRTITPQDMQNEQIWLEAYPKYQQDAANFKSAQFILSRDKLHPFALRIYAPNGKNYTVYKFSDIVTNDPLSFLRGDPFAVKVPWGWKKVVEDVPAPEVSRGPAGDSRR